MCLQCIANYYQSPQISIKHFLGKAGKKVYAFDVYCDPIPTHMTYWQDRDRTSYDAGTIAGVVVPPAGFGYYYAQPSNYTITEASNWNVKDGAFGIAFNLSTFTQQHGAGVYTIMLIAVEGSDQVLLTTTSVFYKR